MVKLNKIYTRAGDDGSTGLVDGSRLGKDALRVRAYGDVDETNSVIGVDVNPHALSYLNRLSDFLFVAARWCNDQGHADVKWVPGQNR